MSATDRIAREVARVQERVRTAALAAGRDPVSVQIVAASKLRTAEEITAAHQAGISAAGENRVQEWLEKRPLCPASLRWHFIGPLQRNKAKLVAGEVELIHSVDRIEIAQTLSEAIPSGQVQPVLLQVNTSDEASKHGFIPDAVMEAAGEISLLHGIEIRGLMTVPAQGDPEPGFRKLQELGALLAQKMPAATELSMGMSDDLELAITYGATLVRPGTALFGPRPVMP